jgi:anaerobic selenocysteine-containing dehydrogenase
MCLGWLKVIFDEGLYDEAFVRDWCVGFAELKQRVDEYPLERVAQITGVPAEDIAAAARMYAQADGAVIPWTPITDQQLSSTSAIRLHSILRAVSGNLDVAGGETLGGFSQTYIPESEIGLHERLSPEQKAKQLGYDDHPAFTYRAAEMLKEPTEKVWGFPYADIVMGCQMANPTSVFRAMVSEDPYPIKAFFCLGNNALLSYANQHQIHQAMLNQELIVAHEIFMTPTAMLADYVLPGDVFTERNHVADGWSWTTRLALSQKWWSRQQQPAALFNFGRISPIAWVWVTNFRGRASRTCSTIGCREVTAPLQSLPARVIWNWCRPRSANTKIKALPRHPARWSLPRACSPIWGSTRCPITVSCPVSPRSTPTWCLPASGKTHFFKLASATLNRCVAVCRRRVSTCIPATQKEKG